MTPSWYDLLGVDPDASAATIRTAWKSAIADLDPGDRRFRLCNTAAEVLLDADRRAAYDAELAAEDAGQQTDEQTDEHDPGETSEIVVPAAVVEDDERTTSGDPAPVLAVPGSDAKVEETDETDESEAVDDDGGDEETVAAREATAEPAAPGRLDRVSNRALAWVTAVLAVLAVALVVTTVVVAVGDDGSDGSGDSSAAADDGGGLPDEKQIDAARAAAEEAVVPVLSYDYRNLDRDQREARSYLTSAYAEQYDRFFQSAVQVNAPDTETIVRVRVLDSATVRTGPGRVDVLLFVNRPTTNKQQTQPIEYHDQVTMRMVSQDGTWLVGCMITEPGTPCPT